MNEGVQVKTLSNGITVLAEKVPELQSFSLGFLFEQEREMKGKKRAGFLIL
ncbi:hypothetical protein HMPREF9466_00899 [Fusobacterium necrophorum subsp. funduliforme 1_1_36S]|uniref:Uncharacterized protein n=1 Tax=Fusobacterium necrophorum subsp. funduliforme B35 TaxID=1226633 RepID=A0A0B4FM02_9FUSO|nr:hypothetical protein HMPREF9466_00899 [Fusobacterium necrophorum subsp. funduliforme 1_1_36S]KID48302.1 hypothetical protein C095_11355 [Fusobacterium necrophorum subsp. funduliforme B35]